MLTIEQVRAIQKACDKQVLVAHDEGRLVQALVLGQMTIPEGARYHVFQQFPSRKAQTKSVALIVFFFEKIQATLSTTGLVSVKRLPTRLNGFNRPRVGSSKGYNDLGEQAP